MNLAQLQTLKTAILADATAAPMAAAGNHIGIAAYLNTAGAGQVYRPAIPSWEMNTGIVWTEYAILTALQQNCYQAMISPGTVDATSANIRAGLLAIFGTAVTTKANLTALISRVQTKGESVFTVASICPLFGTVFTPNDVAQALGS